MNQVRQYLFNVVNNYLPTFHKGPPPDTPMNVMAVNVETTSVSVSWDEVNDADRYTVTFIRATGDEQEGGCRSNTSTHNASITVDVKELVTNKLRAYSTYFITVLALTYEGGISNYSDQISIFTPQIGMHMMIMI